MIEGQVARRACVGDDDDRPLRKSTPDRRQDAAGSGSVHLRQTFIEHQNPERQQQRTGQREALALSARQVAPGFLDRVLGIDRGRNER